jgi:hypothetical protein
VFGLVFTYPLAVRLGTHLSNPGDPLLTSWMLGWNAHALLTPEVGLFDANIFYPYDNTFALSEHLFGLSLFGLPFWIFTGDALFTNNTVLLLCLLLSSFTMYILAFGLTGNYVAAVAAGIIFAYNPFRVQQVSHLHLQGVFWLPLIAFFLMRYMQAPRARDLILFGFALLMQSLSGFYGLAAAGIVVGILGVAGTTLLREPVLGFRRLGGIGAAITLVGLLNLPFVLPYLRIRSELGIERSLAEAALFAAAPRDYLRVTYQHELHGSWLGSLGGSPEGALFPGFTVIALVLVALYGLWRWRRAEDLSRVPTMSRWGWAFAVLVPACFILTLGPWIHVGDAKVPLPYFFLYEALPPLRALRVPSRFHLAFMMGVAVLAAIGYTYVDRQFRHRGRPAHHWPLGITLIILLFVEYATLPFPAATSAFDQRRRDALDYHLRQLGEHAVVVELPMTLPPPPRTFDPTPYEYVYASTRHWRNLVNGVSGFYPPGYRKLSGILDTFPSLASRATLRDLGATHIVVHLDDYPPEIRSTIQSIAAADPHLDLERRFDQTLLFRISSASGEQLAAEWHVPARVPPGEQIVSEIELDDGTHPTTLYPPVPFRVREMRGGAEMVEISTPSNPPITSLPFSAVRIPLEIELGEQRSDGLQFEVVIGTHRFFLRSPKPLLDPALKTSVRPEVLRARFERVSGPAHLVAGEPFWAGVVVRNTGDGYWKARADSAARGEVRLALKDWRNADGTAATAAGARGLLPRDVAPGEAVSAELTGTAPTDPGIYVARLEMVSELVEWSSHVDPTAFAEIVVEIAPGGP